MLPTLLFPVKIVTCMNNLKIILQNWHAQLIITDIYPCLLFTAKAFKANLIPENRICGTSTLHHLTVSGTCISFSLCVCVCESVCVVDQGKGQFILVNAQKTCAVTPSLTDPQRYKITSAAGY